MGMFIRKMTAYRDTSPSGLENGLIPYADIRDDYMTFFAFHGILLGAFLGVYLAICLHSLKAALFILSFFLVNLLSLSYILYSNLNIKER